MLYSPAMRRILTTLALTAGLTLGLTTPSQAAWMGDTLSPGDRMICDSGCDFISSWRVFFELHKTVTSSGSSYTQMIVSPNFSSKVCWSNGAIRGAGDSYLIMQTDGNLVWYSRGKAIWNSRTPGNPGARLVAQGDGNVVLYSKTNRALWSTQTNGTCKI